MGELRRVARGHRGGLTVTYVLLVGENVAELLYPFAIGRAIDDLVDGRPDGLVLFVGTWLVHAALAYVRQRCDTRTATSMYRDLAVSLVRAQRADPAVEVSAVVGRSALAREAVDFFEHTLPVLVTSVFAFAGSLIALVAYDPLLGGVAAALTVPVLLANAHLGRRSRTLHAALNDEVERETAVIEGADPDAIERHYTFIRRQRIALSDAEARTWGLLELFTIGLAVFAFVRTTDLSVEAGTIYAVVAYLWNYVESFDRLPTTVQSFAALRDIGRRIDTPTSPS